MSDERPVLWHIPVSHYNEKARWALAYKGVEHERRVPPPGAHMLVSLMKTRGRSKTFPLLDIDGRSIGDSTEIIAALEELYPKPPLYPSDPAERERALALEDYFDEELGPHIRLLGWHELTRDPERFADLAAEMAPGPLAKARGVAAAGASAFLRLRFGVQSDAGAELARRKVVEALDRLEEELGGGDYLVGEGFTVADLTAASLFYPLVLPPEGPQILSDPPRGFEEFRAPLAERRGYRWVAETFARHRKPAAQRSST
jgi:glutathione S-transferase